MSEALTQPPVNPEQLEIPVDLPDHYIDSPETVDTLQEKVKTMSDVAGDPLFVPNMAQIDTMKQTLAEAEGDDTISPNQKHTLALKSDVATYKLDDEAKAGVERYLKSNDPTHMPEDLIQLRRWMVPNNSKRSEKSLQKSQEKFQEYLQERLTLNDEITAKEAEEAQSEGGRVIPMPRHSTENDIDNSDGKDAEVIDFQKVRPAVPGTEKITEQKSLPPVPGTTEQVNKVTELPAVPGANKEDENLGRYVQEEDGELTYKIGKQNYEDWKKGKLGALNFDAAVSEKLMDSLPPVPAAAERAKSEPQAASTEDVVKNMKASVWDRVLSDIRKEHLLGRKQHEAGEWVTEKDGNRVKVIDKRYRSLPEDLPEWAGEDLPEVPPNLMKDLPAVPSTARPKGVFARMRDALRKPGQYGFAALLGRGAKNENQAQQPEKKSHRKLLVGLAAGALVVGAAFKSYLELKGVFLGGHSGGASQHVNEAIVHSHSALSGQHEAAAAFTTLSLGHKGDNIWTEAGKLWTQHGVANPTNAQIDALKDRILEYNHLTEAQARDMAVGAQFNVPNDFFTSQAGNTAGQLPIVNR